MAEHGVAEVEGARMAWWSQGTGDALVLVHAGVADARMWDGVLALLPRTWRAVTYDMRGFGRTRSAAGPFASARDLAGLLDALGIARAHVAGASFGGQVALELAATQPGRIASLVLLAPALPDIDASPPLRAFAEAEDRAIEDGRLDDAVALNVRMWAGDGAPDVQALVGEMQRTAFELQLAEGAEEQPLEPPVSARLAAIGARATIAIGDRDVSDFARVAERLEAELARAELHRIAGAGHLLALDAPAEVAQLVLRHLAA